MADKHSELEKRLKELDNLLKNPETVGVLNSVVRDLQLAMGIAQPSTVSKAELEIERDGVKKELDQVLSQEEHQTEAAIAVQMQASEAALSKEEHGAFEKFMEKKIVEEKDVNGVVNLIVKHPNSKEAFEETKKTLTEGTPGAVKKLRDNKNPLVQDEVRRADEALKQSYIKSSVSREELIKLHPELKDISDEEYAKLHQAANESKNGDDKSIRHLISEFQNKHKTDVQKATEILINKSPIDKDKDEDNSISTTVDEFSNLAEEAKKAAQTEVAKNSNIVNSKVQEVSAPTIPNVQLKTDISKPIQSRT